MLELVFDGSFSMSSEEWFFHVMILLCVYGFVFSSSRHLLVPTTCLFIACYFPPPTVRNVYTTAAIITTTTMTTTLSWLVHSVGGYCWVEMDAEILCGALHRVATIWFLHLGSIKYSARVFDTSTNMNFITMKACWVLGLMWL